MTYIPVGSRLTYTCVFQYNLVTRAPDPQALVSKLKNDLPNLDGLEDLEVENAHGGNLGFLSTTQNIELTVLNNGVDHGDENDIKSIIDGTIQNYGVQLVSSNITQIKLPNNPGETQGQTIRTGATSSTPPETPSSGGLSSLFNFSTGTKLLGTGTIIIIAIVALILLLPGGFAKVVRTARG